MSNKEKKSPELRFKGFSDAWEQRKVADLGQISAGGDIKKDKLVNNGQYPVFANSLQNQGNIGYYNEYKYTFPAVTVTGRGDIGKAIARHENFNAVVRLLVISLYEGYDANFLAKAINNMTIYIESTGVPQLTAPQLSNYRILIPKFFEQKTIGTFFLRLDNIINLHQRKINILKKLNQTYIEKLFPFDENLLPELRFFEFEDVWKEYKLEELGYTFTGLSGKTKDDFGHGEAEYVTYLNVFNNPISNLNMTEKTKKDSKQNALKYGDVLFTTSSETPNEVGMSSVWLGVRDDVYLNSFCFGFRPTMEIDHFFLASLLRSNTIRKQMFILAQGISRYNISKSKVMKIKTSLPTLTEQRRIGFLIKKLNDEHELLEQKLKSLQKIKKVFLHKMFL